MPQLDHLGAPSLWAIAMMFLSAVIFLYRKDSSSCEECKKELNLIRIQLLTESKKASEDLLAAQQRYTVQLESLHEKFTNIISGNLQAMEGMRDNLSDLRETIIEKKSPKRGPRV